MKSHGSSHERRPADARWRPVLDLGTTLYNLRNAADREATARWHAVRRKLEDPELDRSTMEI